MPSAFISFPFLLSLGLLLSIISTPGYPTFLTDLIISLRSRLNEIYVNHTGKDLKTIEAALDRDTFMTSDDAKKFGLIDKVVQKRDVEEK